jgi:glycine cleavage system H protein
MSSETSLQQSRSLKGEGYSLFKAKGDNMSEIPADLKYTDSHEWVRDEGNGVCTVGITFHAQHLLGDLVFVELPDVKKALTAGEEAGVVESVKAASDVYSPVTGTITAINETLASTPELINEDPYIDGWLFKVKLEDEDELESLLNAEEYAEKITEED